MKLNYFNYRAFHDKILLTNDFGDYAFLSEAQFKNFVAGNLDDESDLGKYVISKRMAYSGSGLAFTADNRYDLRIRKMHLITATSLHIFVVTTACNMKCLYCQANNGLTSSSLVMDEITAERAVDVALSSPSGHLTFEFQGGEPLINFTVIRHIVEYAEEKKGKHHIEYNVVTNLTLLTDEMLSFFAAYKFGISTSLDGPEHLHNKNRPFMDGRGSYRVLMKEVDRVRATGLNIGAIETTTRDSLLHPEEIVNIYSEIGFDSVFLRPLTPLGRASKRWESVGYTADEFLNFYRKAFLEILKINRSGKYLKESHASIFLGKIFGYGINYMELRSPCGAGIGQLAYYADGNVFTCDEARMLYQMGDTSFLLGNVEENSYREMISSKTCRAACISSITESLPRCCDCVFQPYCGVCPVVNLSVEKDLISKQPRQYRCEIYSGILETIFEILLGDDQEKIDTLKSWSG